MNKQDRVEKFMAVSYLYFQLHNKTSDDVSSAELTEFFEAVNADTDSMLCTDYLS